MLGFGFPTDATAGHKKTASKTEAVKAAKPEKRKN
jgi:hypothetical protein